MFFEVRPVPHPLGWVSLTALYFKIIEIKNYIIHPIVLRTAYPQTKLLILKGVTYPTASGGAPVRHSVQAGFQLLVGQDSGSPDSSL